MPLKFKAERLVVGNPTSDAGIITSWSDPQDIVDPEILEHAYCVAPLRTLSGLSIMLANLARNPQIRRLVIYNRGDYDEKTDAMIPKRHLMALFSDGVEDDGTIVGTNFKLPDELVRGGGVEVLRRIIQNVQVVSTTSNRDELIDVLKDQGNASPYMEPHIFPEFEIKAAETLPSERFNIVVREKTLPQAWLGLLYHITRYGVDCELETGGAQVRELPFVRVVIENQGADMQLPPWIGGIVQLGITPEKLEAYYTTKILPTPYEEEIYPGVKRFVRPETTSYLYSELLFYYPTRPQEFDDFVIGVAQVTGVNVVATYLKQAARNPRNDADTIAENVLADTSLSDKQKVQVLLEVYVPPINQVDQVINRIKNSPDDVDKVAFLWLPDVHGVRNHGRPCFTQIAFLVRGGKISMKVTFRSHDGAKGWFENLYGAWGLMCDIAQETGYDMGTIVAESESGHIYQGDLPWVLELIQKEVLDVPSVKVFDSETMGDPRGNWSVNVINGQIVAILKDPSTDKPLAELFGRTARNIMAQMRHLKLMADADHALDIGAELAKAELCNLVGLPYVQDKPLDFRKIRIGLEAVEQSSIS